MVADGPLRMLSGRRQGGPDIVVRAHVWHSSVSTASFAAPFDP